MERSDVTFWVLIHDFTCQVSLCLSLWTAFAFGEIFTWLWGEKKTRKQRGNGEGKGKVWGDFDKNSVGDFISLNRATWLVGLVGLEE